MKIKYNEIEKSLEIKDRLKTHYFALKMLMILNLIIALSNIFLIKKDGINAIEIIWLLVALISLTILFIFIFKKSTSEKIPIEMIKQLKQKSLLGRTRFSLELHNGKERDLTELKTQTEIIELKKIFSEIGIAN